MDSAFDDQGKQWVWDSTSIKRTETCLRKYQYEALEGWRSPYRSVHLWFGGLYASALEHFHKHMAEGKSYDEALVEVVAEAMINSWDHELNEQGERAVGTGAAATFDNNVKTRETLIRSIIWYLENFREDYFQTFITNTGAAAVEFTFKIDVDNGLMFSGHIDRLCVDPGGDIFVHDQKTTTATLGPHYFNQFKPDSQFSMYTFAGKMIYNAPVKGVIIDAAQVAVGFTRYARSPTFRMDDELEEWYSETMYRIEEVHRAVERNYFPRNPASCNNYGGCPYRQVCSRPLHVRENFLEASFVRGERWEPLANR
jgi:hypothetical protein